MKDKDKKKFYNQVMKDLNKKRLKRISNDNRSIVNEIIFTVIAILLVFCFL